MRPVLPLALRFAAVTLAAGLALPASAQHLGATGSVGLKALPDERRFFDVPLDAHWTVGSWRSFPPLPASEGLKVDFGGRFGWDVGASNRVSVGAGLGVSNGISRSTPDARLRELTGDPTMPTLSARDVGLNVAWAWRYSSSLALTSGLDVRYSLADPLDRNTTGSAFKPSSAAGFVGLRLKF